jgi:Trk K+ transport system NAD-binding subunit
LNWAAFGFIAILIIITRPLSVYLSTIGSKLNNKEKIFISWMAPRGVVAASISSLFAIELVQSGYSEAEQIVPIVFIIIISTVAIYGLSAPAVARYLGVAKPIPSGFLILGAHSWARRIGVFLNDNGFKVLLADSNWSNINKARNEGLETYYGNILAEYAIDEINFDGIGKLLALTPNDEVNSLAVIRFAELFSYSGVYQLPAITKAQRKEREVPDNLSGRILFEETFNFEKFSDTIDKGGTFKVLELEDSLTQAEFDERFTDHIPLFILTKSGDANPVTIDHTPLPGAGDKILFLTNPVDVNKEVNIEGASENTYGNRQA